MGVFSSKCDICGSLEHATSNCPHGIFSVKCDICGSKDHSTKDCPHGIFSNQCSVCGSKNHATKDCPHGFISSKCDRCGSLDHATKDCPHGIFSIECAICGSKNHATKDCHQGFWGGRTTSKHQTGTGSSSDEGGLSGFVGKMLGYLIVGIIILAVVLWLLQNIVLPIILLNSALILTIIALSTKKQRTLFAVSALVGGGYMILDILNRWFSANFVENVVKNPEWISGIVYVNSAAIVLSAWFLVQPILSNAMFIRVTNKSRGFLLTFIAYFIVIASGITIPLIYHTQPNSFVSNYLDISLGAKKVEVSKESIYIKDINGQVTAMIDELNGTTFGIATGITYITTPNGQGALFSKTNESCIEYPFSMGLPHEGTIEMLIKVTNGYSYGNYSLIDEQQSACIFNTGSSDVWYLGAMWLVVNKNGDVSLSTALTASPTSHTLTASNTAFRFNEWHIVSFSYGNQGQYLKIDGHLVAANPDYTETLQTCGNKGNTRCMPTIGEMKSVFWKNNQYDQGFEGVMDRFRASNVQRDWLF